MSTPGRRMTTAWPDSKRSACSWRNVTLALRGMLLSRGTESTVTASCLVQLFGFLGSARVGQHVSNLTEPITLLPRERLTAVIFDLQFDLAAIVIVDEASEG